MEELYEWINHSRHPYDIDEFVSAVTKIEHGFANILNSEAQYLLRNKDRLTPQEVLKFNEHLEEILKLAIKKEIILEFLLDEIKTCPKRCKLISPKMNLDNKSILFYTA